MSALFTPARFRPLLPAGIHPTDWNGLRRLCVDYFPSSTTRPQMMSTISMIGRLVNEASIPARLWIGGDFLTERENPQACSLAIVLVETVYASLSSDQLEFFEWFRNSSLVDQYKCETYGLVLDAGRNDWEFLYAYWLNQYGLGRQSTSTGVIEVLMPTLIKP
jgi:hypothetical protein